MLALRDVPRDLRGADDIPVEVLDRGDRQGDVQTRTILSYAHCFIMIDAFTAPELLKNGGLLVDLIGWNQQRDRFADDFLRAVAENAFGATDSRS